MQALYEHQEEYLRSKKPKKGEARQGLRFQGHRMTADVKKKIEQVENTQKHLEQLKQDLTSGETNTKEVGHNFQIVLRLALLDDEEAHGVFSTAGRVREGLHTALDRVNRLTENKLTKEEQRDQAIMMRVLEKLYPEFLEEQSQESLDRKVEAERERAVFVAVTYQEIMAAQTFKDIENCKTKMQGAVDAANAFKNKSDNPGIEEATKLFKKMSSVPKPKPSGP